MKNQKQILAEANKIYEYLSKSKDIESQRQAKTAQIMFIAGANWATGVKTKIISINDSRKHP